MVITFIIHPTPTPSPHRGGEFCSPRIPLLLGGGARGGGDKLFYLFHHPAAVALYHGDYYLLGG